MKDLIFCKEGNTYYFLNENNEIICESNVITNQVKIINSIGLYNYMKTSKLQHSLIMIKDIKVNKQYMNKGYTTSLLALIRHTYKSSIVISSDLAEESKLIGTTQMDNKSAFVCY